MTFFNFKLQIANFILRYPQILKSKELRIKGMQGTIYSKGFPILSEATDFAEYSELMDSIMNKFTFD